METDLESGGDTPTLEGPSPAEKEASLYGWKPQEEFTGPEGKWRSAEEFLEEGKRINGFLRKDLDTLRRELSSRDATLAELQKTVTDFAKFHEETEARAYERARKELKEGRAAALRENDGAAVVEIEERMEELEEARREAAAKPSPRKPSAPDPVWNAWVGENSWYAENTKARAVANGYSDVVRAEAPTLVGKPFLEEVKRRVQEDFPEFFENGNRGRAASVGSSSEGRSGGLSGGGKKSFSDLPPEAKVACDRFVKQKLVPSREAYVKDYFGE